MSRKHIFTQFIDTDDLRAYMDETDLADGEKDELITIVHKTIHVEIVNMALSELPESERQQVAHYLEHRPDDDGLLIFLRRTIDRFEDRVADLVHMIKLDFKQSLHDYRSASEEWLEGDLRK